MTLEASVEQSLSGSIHVERLAMAIHNVKGGSPMFGEPGECECREDAAAIAHEYARLGNRRDYLRRLPWRENVVLERLDQPGNRADGVR